VHVLKLGWLVCLTVSFPIAQQTATRKQGGECVTTHWCTWLLCVR
jgi:hypothetical protein